MWGNGSASITKSNKSPAPAEPAHVVETKTDEEVVVASAAAPLDEVVAPVVVAPAVVAPAVPQKPALEPIKPQTGNAWEGALTFAQLVEKEARETQAPTKEEVKPKSSPVYDSSGRGGRGSRGRGGRGEGRGGRGEGRGRGGRGGRGSRGDRATEKTIDGEPTPSPTETSGASPVQEDTETVEPTPAPVSVSAPETETNSALKIGNLDSTSDAVDSGATFHFGSFGTAFGASSGDSTSASWGLNNTTSSALPNASLNIGTIGGSTSTVNEESGTSPINELRDQSQSWNANANATNNNNSGNTDKSGYQGQQNYRGPQQFSHNQRPQYYQQGMNMGMGGPGGSSLGGMGGRTGLDMNPYAYGNMFYPQQHYGMNYNPPAMATSTTGSGDTTSTTSTTATGSNFVPNSGVQPQYPAPGMGMGYGGGYYSPYYSNQNYYYNQQGGGNYGMYPQRGMYNQQRGGYNGDYQNGNQQQGYGNTDKGSPNQNYGGYGGQGQWNNSGMTQGSTSGSNSNTSATANTNTNRPANTTNPSANQPPGAGFGGQW